jgi:hypothetical protein
MKTCGSSEMAECRSAEVKNAMHDLEERDGRRCIKVIDVGPLKVWML